MAVPQVPAYLDAVLCDTPLTGGIEPKLGKLHLRILTVLGFPERDDAGAARCAQRPGLRLPLGDALDPARQDRGDAAAHQAAPALVRQAQVGRLPCCAR